MNSNNLSDSFLPVVAGPPQEDTWFLRLTEIQFDSFTDYHPLAIPVWDGWGPSYMTATSVLDQQRVYTSLIHERFARIYSALDCGSPLREIMDEIFQDYGVGCVHWADGQDPRSWGEFQECTDSVVSGNFEASAALRRDEFDGDDLGSDYDPGEMGTAEIWFRTHQEDMGIIPKETE